MKKLKFEEISDGDWIYWIEYDKDDTDYFVSVVKKIDRKKSELLEEWWRIKNTLKKFDNIADYKNNDIFKNEDLKGYDIIRKMTEKEIKDFKVKLTVINL
ncbi:hypothetical protein LCGC14_0622800 [marine sediment metagenome]|uniref:Uncharacterized protein n=1 Tax=marine sediment metagenome TaxID=412755 RepID=A0A0F9R9F2_9ZZZZ